MARGKADWTRVGGSWAGDLGNVRLKVVQTTEGYVWAAYLPGGQEIERGVCSGVVAAQDSAESRARAYILEHGDPVETERRPATESDKKVAGAVSGAFG